MKKTIVTFIALACGAAVQIFAQQAIWGVPSIISPEVSTDRTVTFRLNAPNAQKVMITGDFLKSGVVEMEKDTSGIWTFTSEAINPEMYRYNYIVDGLTIADPANVFEVRDACTVFNYFLVPGEGSRLYEINDVDHGTVAKVWYDSPALGMKRRMSIYTPPGYETSGDRRYPVLYLLHGMGGDEEAWLTQGRAAQILDNLIAEGAVEPMIVVMPNGNASQEAAPGETHFGLVPPTVALPHTMDGAFEEAFPDIIAYVDRTYRRWAASIHCTLRSSILTCLIMSVSSRLRSIRGSKDRKYIKTARRSSAVSLPTLPNFTGSRSAKTTSCIRTTRHTAKRSMIWA